MDLVCPDCFSKQITDRDLMTKQVGKGMDVRNVIEKLFILYSQMMLRLSNPMLS